MTATDQDEAAKEAVRRIDRTLTPYVPDVSRWDLALKIVADLREDHWRCMPPDPKLTRVTTGTGTGTPPADVDLEAARKACETASTKLHRRETP